MDGAYGYLMLFTGDPDRYQQAQPGDRTDDLRTKRVPQRDGLLVLDPGQSFTATWGITPIPGPTMS
jgi:hypothetical protein